MTELLVGTKKGLFRLEGDPSSGFEVTARAFAGQSVEYAMRDPRTGRYLASVTSWFYGPRIWVTDDPTGEWEQAKGTSDDSPGAEQRRPRRVQGAGAALGDRPGRGGRCPLRGRRPRPALREPRRRAHLVAQPRPLGSPDAARVEPGRRRPVPPHDRHRGPATRRAARRDLRRRRLALRRRRRVLAPLERGDRAPVPTGGGARPRPRSSSTASTTSAARRSGPSGCSCSSTTASTARTTPAATWIDVGTDKGLPSDFGFPIVVDPADPDSAYVIPLIGAEDRTTPGGTVRVWETRDAGASWSPAATGSRSRTRTSRPARGVRHQRARARRSSSTSAPPRARCSAPATPARRGRRSADHLPPVYSVRTA